MSLEIDIDRPTYTVRCSACNRVCSCIECGQEEFSIYTRFWMHDHPSVKYRADSLMDCECGSQVIADTPKTYKLVRAEIAVETKD